MKFREKVLILVALENERESCERNRALPYSNRQFWNDRISECNGVIGTVNSMDFELEDTNGSEGLTVQS